MTRRKQRSDTAAGLVAAASGNRVQRYEWPAHVPRPAEQGEQITALFGELLAERESWNGAQLDNLATLCVLLQHRANLLADLNDRGFVDTRTTAHGGAFLVKSARVDGFQAVSSEINRLMSKLRLNTARDPKGDARRAAAGFGARLESHRDDLDGAEDIDWTAVND